MTTSHSHITLLPAVIFGVLQKKCYVKDHPTGGHPLPIYLVVCSDIFSPVQQALIFHDYHSWNFKIPC